MSVETIPLSRIEKNPYRDLEGHPLRREQVDHLKASIGSTQFWGGLMVRPHPERAGHYQLAFGHARFQAASEAGIERADFIVRDDLDDNKMIRAMADENVTQFGKDEYKTYREAVTAAVERIMTGLLIEGDPPSTYIEGAHDRNEQDFLDAIRSGDAPGENVVARYFKGTLSLPAIRMALREYRETGRLAAWHAKHNPKATKPAEAPKLNSAALSKFEETAHVQTFARTCERLGIPPDKQEHIADQVLEQLKVPKAKPAKTPRGERASKQYARTAQPRQERLTSANIRQEVTAIVGKAARSPSERRRLEAEAHAISIESALSEMAIGLKRAAKAASDLVGVANVIGGLQVDMTPIARGKFAECHEAWKAIETSLKAATEAGLRVNIRRLK